MYRHFSVQPPPPSNFNPRLPAAVDAVLIRALSKKPEERFPSIIDFAYALTEAARQPAMYSEDEMANYATLTLSQSEAEAGISRMLTLEGGEEITVSVPAGAQDGQVLRLAGAAPSAGEQAGVVLVNIAIKQAEKSRSTSGERSAQTPETPLPSNVARAASGEQAVGRSSSGSVQAGSKGQASETPPLQRVSLSASAPLSTPEHDLPTVASVRNVEPATMAPVTNAAAGNHQPL